jgi:hypothetical protein
MALTWLLTWRQSLARSSAATYLAFLAVFGAVSTQYYVWPLALMLISDLPLVWSVVYSLATGLGAIGYYLVYWPPIILGPAGSGGPRPQFVPEYIVGEVVAWSVIVVVYVISIGRPRSAGRWWAPAVGVTTLAVAVTAIPVVRQVAWLAEEWLRFSRS